ALRVRELAAAHAARRAGVAPRAYPGSRGRFTVEAGRGPVVVRWRADHDRQPGRPRHDPPRAPACAWSRPVRLLRQVGHHRGHAVGRRRRTRLRRERAPPAAASRRPPPREHAQRCVPQRGFGTRHDVLGTPVDRFIKTADELVGGMESVQMIHDMQVIKPGATLYTGLHLVAPTFGHLAAFATAWNEAAPWVDGRGVINLGGKRSVGYGACAVVEEKHPSSYRYNADELVAAYETHLRDHRAEILTLLEEITS